MTFADSRMFRTTVAPVWATIRSRVRGNAAIVLDAGRTLREGLAYEIGETAGPAAATVPAATDRAPGRDPTAGGADHWVVRAMAAEARAAELERRLMAAERDVLELRSRNVCLQGKLAAASATARYQSLALELDAEAAPPSLGR